MTRPLIFSGNTLQLNVDTSAGGIVKAELQDPTGRPLPGFTEFEADEINGNSVRMPVKWQGHDDVGSFAGIPIRLRFIMRDTKLYSFQFLR